MSETATKGGAGAKATNDIKDIRLADERRGGSECGHRSIPVLRHLQQLFGR